MSKQKKYLNESKKKHLLWLLSKKSKIPDGSQIVVLRRINNGNSTINVGDVLIVIDHDGPDMVIACPPSKVQKSHDNYAAVGSTPPFQPTNEAIESLTDGTALDEGNGGGREEDATSNNRITFISPSTATYIDRNAPRRTNRKNLFTLRSGDFMLLEDYSNLLELITACKLREKCLPLADSGTKCIIDDNDYVNVNDTLYFHSEYFSDLI